MNAVQNFESRRNLLILLILFIFLGCNQGWLRQSSLEATETKYDKKQEKGPVYHPLREKPYTKNTFKA